MNRTRSLLLLACSLLCPAGSASAQDKPAASADGWITMFDGKTLNGWKAAERPDAWTVEEGAIVGRGDRSHLFYVAQEFENFEFKADVMINQGGNSGIYFHSAYQETGWPAQGYESQVNCTHRDPVKTGSLYNTVKVFESAGKDDTWWTQEVVVQGKRVTVKIDGKVLFEFVEPEGPTGPKKLGKGLFAFQQHDPGSVVRYRNVMVRPLPASK
jgi:hypothetical protein